MYVLAALACREARSNAGRFDVLDAFDAFVRESFPAWLAPFKLVVRLVWDVGEYGRYVVGLRLVDAGGVDLVPPQSAAFSMSRSSGSAWRGGRSSSPCRRWRRRGRG